MENIYNFRIVSLRKLGNCGSSEHMGWMGEFRLVSSQVIDWATLELDNHTTELTRRHQGWEITWESVSCMFLASVLIIALVGFSLNAISLPTSETKLESFDKTISLLFWARSRATRELLIRRTYPNRTQRHFSGLLTLAISGQGVGSCPQPPLL